MNLKNILKKFTWQPANEYDFSLYKTTPVSNNNNENQNKQSNQNSQNNQNIKNIQDNKTSDSNNKTNISTNISFNLDFIKRKYNTKINNDIVIREFTLNARNKQYKSFLLLIDGMVNSNLINDFILNPLMLRNNANTFNSNENRVISENKTSNNIIIRKIKKFDILQYVSDSLLPQNNITKETTFEEIFQNVNSGNCALFIDTLNVAFNIDVKGFQQRNVDTPNNEVVIKGPQEAFVENLRTNTSLLRRIINSENLIIENINIGEITKTKCCICYLQNIANDNLVNEVKYRLNNIKIDSLLSSGQLEQLLISNELNLGIPEILSSERPDKASKYLLQGRVVILVNGSPYCLIMPACLIDFMSSPEDTNLKPYFGNFLRIIRFLSGILTLLLPGIYVAITSYHQEILPTELLNSILAARESVPFPVIFEILIMEVSFELIREAGLRVPSPIGPTIGIVGALVLGQAAVSANIVSPILIIIVALTGIASFAIPDFIFGFHLRIYRFLFILLGFISGFLGIAVGLYIYISIMCNIKSFGVPFTTPFAPYINSKGNGYIIPAIWKQEYRATFLSPKKKNAQEKISMKWRYKNQKI